MGRKGALLLLVLFREAAWLPILFCLVARRYVVRFMVAVVCCLATRRCSLTIRWCARSSTVTFVFERRRYNTKLAEMSFGGGDVSIGF